MYKNLSNRVEEIVVKGTIAHQGQYLLLSQCFQTLSSADVSTRGKDDLKQKVPERAFTRPKFSEEKKCKKKLLLSRKHCRKERHQM